MLEYLSLHTKVRRLGYLKLLVEQYFERDFIQINSFNIFFEKVASDAFIQKQLEDYGKLYRKNNKGIIENINTGTSAEPYVNLAEDLSIIAKSNYSYILTKYGKIYKVVLERYSKEKSKFKYIEDKWLLNQATLFNLGISQSNTFVLNPVDKFFFLKQLLEKDFLFLKSILKIIFDKQVIRDTTNIKFNLIKEILLSEVVSQLRDHQKVFSNNSSIKSKSIEFEKKFLEKDLKIRSYESIVEPRMNWLLDLDLLDGFKLSQDIIKLSEPGKVLFEKLRSVYDINLFLENDYVKTFAAVYRLSPLNEIYPDRKLKKYLDYAFINFKTLAPNRIPASQAINYISMMCFLREGFIIEYSEIKKYIFDIDGKGYSIDWFPSENDGSIKKFTDG